MGSSTASLRSAEESQYSGPQPLLQVQDLSVRIFRETTHGDAASEIRPLKDISFQIQRGEVVGLLGESGAGKTTLALALMRLLPSCSRVVQGSIHFEGRPFLSLSQSELQNARGARISLIHQDSSVLNPVLRVGDHLVEVLRSHYNWSRSQYRDRAIALLEDMELRDVERIYTAYPHQLSGGQRQRIVIAQALVCHPALVIADEPTASLDPDTSAEIVELLERVKQRFQTAVLLISHDLVPLQKLADRIMVMYAGRIVEQGSRDEILHHPAHPYTQALMACALSQDSTRDLASKGPIPTIPGASPKPDQETIGCDFENRCPDRMDICRTRLPGETRQSITHTVRCFKFGG